MSSINIYATIKPTYLYIKQHSITGLKYFGKTTRKNPITYLGSGVYWKKHIKKYGTQFVETLWISELFTVKHELFDFALRFSIENDIVESEEWANLINETGLDSFIITPEIREKIKQTNLEKYGYENPFQVPEIISKMQQDYFLKTGYKNCSQHPEIKDKKVRTCFEHYGVEHGFQLIKVRKQTCLEKYGVEHPMQHDTIKQKVISTNLKKYGTENVLSKDSLIYIKRNETVLEKYGKTNVFSVPEIKTKIKQTNENKPLVECPHCFKIGKGGNFTRHHFEKCKLKI